MWKLNMKIQIQPKFSHIYYDLPPLYHNDNLSSLYIAIYDILIHEETRSRIKQDKIRSMSVWKIEEQKKLQAVFARIATASS